MTVVMVGAGLMPFGLAAGGAGAAPIGQGFDLNASDLRFILDQIKISERHARTATAANPCGTLVGNDADQIPTGPNGIELPWGLRTVDGTCNNLLPGQEKFGAADARFLRMTRARFRDAENGTTYSSPNNAMVVDSRPRVISNLVVDQTKANPAARAATGLTQADVDALGRHDTLPIPNVAPDVGLSAPFNSVFTLFGQFFDHGLDLVTKGGNVVFMPLQPDDPLIAGADGELGTTDDLPLRLRFMVLTRTQDAGGQKEATNTTTPFVDQNQTYTSHPSHQVFLREYAASPTGPASTGHLIENRPEGGMANWDRVQEQAATLLGIQLGDLDALSVPLLATDPYGRFTPGPNGFPQVVVMRGGSRELVEGDPTADGGAGIPLDTDDYSAVRTGHAFLVDIAHHAVPVGDLDHDPGTPPTPLTPDENDTVDASATPGTYDDEMLGAHFIAGDGRVNENIGLTSIHHVFHSEHNRLVGDIQDVITDEEADPAIRAQWRVGDDPTGEWNGERLFQAARFVTEMEYQHLVFEEFGRKVQPMINAFGEGGTGYDTSVNPAIRAEFAHAVYRFGHSMLTETVARRNSTANGGKANDIALLEAFLNPPAFRDGGMQLTEPRPLTPDEAAGSVFRGMSRQVGNEIDEFVTEALRNNLLGLPLDLATINIARARDAGVPPLNQVRREFYAESNNSALEPYTSWLDFRLNLRHRESLVNFVAAYGTHPTITGTLAERRAAAAQLISPTYDAPPVDPAEADARLAFAEEAAAFLGSAGAWEGEPTGLEQVDLWVGGLAEKPMVFGGMLGATFNYVFETQLEHLQFGDRFYYLSRTAGLNLLTQLEGNSFAELVMRNTDLEGAPADLFSRPDYIFNVGALGVAGPILDDPSTPYDESDTTSEPGSDLSRVPAGTLRYSGPAHVVFNGTSDNDRVWSSEGDDTIRGNDGDDWMQGGDGADNLIGGAGRDILVDLFGDDTLKGGPGNDALSSGQGFGGDLNQGGTGHDFIVGGNDMTESFAGPGNDFVMAGDGEDTVFGDDGDDWIEGGTGPFNLLQGDNGAPFQNDPNEPGHDVLDGDGGEQDFDAEGGDDIMLMGPGIQRAEGMLGYDWATHKGDPTPADSDMEFTGLLPPSIETLRDRFDLVESLSGWDKDDVLRGDDVTAADRAGHELTPAGVARIAGLADLLPNGPASANGGNIILGGGGDDVLEGRGGDDILDGDRWLDVQLRAPDPANPGQFRLVDRLKQLQGDVFAGRLDPGDISIVRSIKVGAPGAIGEDIAVFSDARANYDCVVAGRGPEECGDEHNGVDVTVVHARGAQTDGTDVVRNVERLVFSDSVAPAAPTVGVAVAGNRRVVVPVVLPTNAAVNTLLVRVVGTNGQQIGALRTFAADGVETVEVRGLTNGTPVRLQVAGVNQFGQGPFSALSNQVTPAPEAPTAPRAPAATAAVGSATVTWTLPVDDGGADLVRHDVRVVDADLVQVGSLRTAAGDATSLVVGGLTPGALFRFQVRAVNSAGAGPWSPLTASVRPPTTPTAPSIGAVTRGPGSATVRWVPPGDDGGSAVTGFVVEVLDAAGDPVGEPRSTGAGATSLVVDGLTDGTPYRFRVRARNVVGASPASGVSETVVPASRPSSPAAPTASEGNRSATVTWEPPASDGGVPVTGYRLKVLDDDGAQVGDLLTADASSRSLVVPRLTNGRTYRFQVLALNEVGASELSPASAPVRPATVPGRTRIRFPSSGAPGGRTTATARWAPPTTDGGAAITGYEVQALRLSRTGRVVRRLTATVGPRRTRYVFRLPAGRYRFQVAATNRVGTGRASAASRVVRAR